MRDENRRGECHGQPDEEGRCERWGDDEGGHDAISSEFKRLP